jgi:hypothetical protein
MVAGILFWSVARLHMNVSSQKVLGRSEFSDKPIILGTENGKWQ